MILLLLLSLLAYGYIILQRWVAWRNMPDVVLPPAYEPRTLLSVIIPVRNEGAHISHLLHDLEQQQYPHHLFEVLVVDDHSDDTTTAQVEDFIENSPLQLRLVRLSAYQGLMQKKAAVKKGVELAKGELLVLTDGDCRVQPEWLALYDYLYVSQKPLFISGPVCFDHTETLFERMQLVEFASLIGIGAASIGLGKPNMCNGANLAYTRQAFEAVGGFAGNEGIASGDDEFLLHKINRRFPGRIAFLKNEKAAVYTSARKTVVSFLAQRVRWASKWKAYQEWHVKLVALSVFTVNLLLLLIIPMGLTGKIPFYIFLGAYFIKFGIDFIFLERILLFFGKRKYLFYMLPLQLVYVPYVLITGITGLFGRYSWKGRKIRNL
ncbi:glycosyltransferase [Botryobacter ruber]|uniref:glycosyltransferase n=1 Tax=Botryobacter ruber TaxID=2171629 RepID=UPI000E0CA049|nr:glycosyltransferase [Botryobacter ruber]